MADLILAESEPHKRQLAVRDRTANELQFLSPFQEWALGSGVAG